MINQQHLHYVVDIDIEGFFDNVNHNKLIKQMWNLGIQDKQLLCIIKAMLKAPITMPNGEKFYPNKGIPQGGILSPLLANICLNEFDWWVSSQWESIPTRTPYKNGRKTDQGRVNDRGNTFKLLKKSTTLKEVFIIRYADDFKIFCRNKEVADKMFIATEMWLRERLDLQISKEKSKVTNLKNNYSEYLGFKLKAKRKGNSHYMESHISDKNIKRIKNDLKKTIKFIQHSGDNNTLQRRVSAYNYKVIGVHLYYGIATHVSRDCRAIGYEINWFMKHRLGGNLKKHGKCRELYIRDRYGQSESLRFIDNQTICPITFVKTRYPMYKKRNINKYTPEGRKEIHKNLGVDISIMREMMVSERGANSIEFTDNRISLYCAQQGKCAVMKTPLYRGEIYCHHKIPRSLGGDDSYDNLVIIHPKVHRLIHATETDTINKLRGMLKLSQIEIKRVNRLRKLCGNMPLSP